MVRRSGLPDGGPADAAGSDRPGWRDHLVRVGIQAALDHEQIPSGRSGGSGGHDFRHNGG